MNKSLIIKIKNGVLKNIPLNISGFLKNKDGIYKILFKLSIIFIISVFASNAAIKFITYKIFQYDLQKAGITPKTFNANLVVKKPTIKRYSDILKFNPINAVVNGPLLNFNAKDFTPSLNLTLIGTISGSFGYAFFINKTDGKELFIPQGAEIKPGYYLSAVKLKSAVISGFGRRFTISLVKIKNGNASAFSSGPSAINTPHPAGSMSSLSSAVKKTGPYSYLIDRSKIKKSDLNSIFTQMHAVPDIVNGKIIGFKVLTVVPTGIFAYMGFQPGDIIKSVNGTPLSSPQEAVNLLSGLMNENNVSIDLTQDAQNITMNYRIE